MKEGLLEVERSDFHIDVKVQEVLIGVVPGRVGPYEGSDRCDDEQDSRSSLDCHELGQGLADPTSEPPILSNPGEIRWFVMRSSRH